MTRQNAAVHIVTTTRTYKGKQYRTHLLRRSYREDGKVKNKTVGNLSYLPEPIVEMVRSALRGNTFIADGATQPFDILQSRAHGHVDAVLTAMRHLGLPQLLASRPSRERSIVMGMIAARVINPRCKLATTRWWHSTTLPSSLGQAFSLLNRDMENILDFLLAT